MEIRKIGSQPSTKGPAENFTGNVRVDSRFASTVPARVSGAICPLPNGYWSMMILSLQMPELQPVTPRQVPPGLAFGQPEDRLR